jgi:hypothetical protein
VLTDEGNNLVSKYERDDEAHRWRKICDLQQAKIDTAKQVLQLQKPNKDGKKVFGEYRSFYLVQ